MTDMMMPQDDIQVTRDGDRVFVNEPTEIGDANDAVLGDDDHDANLAEDIAGEEGGEGYLTELAVEIISAVERDDKSRSRWKKILANGIRLMGVSPDRMKGANFPGSSKVVHPVLTEACVQFQARAMAEMWPPAGPVKSFIPGKKDRALLLKQRNVENYMNWQYTVDMTEAYWELDQMLFRLPLEGSAFKQQYFDAELMRTTTRFLTAEDVIVSNRATDLMTAPRVTVKKRIRDNTMKKYMVMGIFRQLDITPEPLQNEESGDDEIEEAIDASEGRDTDEMPDTTPGTPLSNEEFLNYEVRVDLDLKFFKDRAPGEVTYDPETGEPIEMPGEETGIRLPYIVTVNTDSKKILSIVRNWDKEDEHRRKLMDIVHYKYLPGFGFYGYGLLHTIGSLTEAATGALRALLDSAAFANMQGGFKTKNIKIGQHGEMVVAPGQWQDVPATVEDIRKGLFPLPYKEPSDTLFKLLGALVEYGQRFASTTESMVGDAANTGPVGTTLALIEQGSKVFSAIHKRCHRAQGEEFRQIGALNKKHIPIEGLTFHFASNDNTITRDDFDAKIDIIPVSDPNIFSQTQRITLAQGVKQLAMQDQSGKLYDMYEVDRNLLEAMRVPDVDRFLKNPKKDIPSLSPVYENMMILQGKPVQAYLHQDQRAHMIAHATFIAGLPPAFQKAAAAAMQAHIAEHMALQYYLQVEAMTGVDLPPPPQFRGPDTEESMQNAEVPPEIENKIANLAAMAGEKAAVMRAKKQQAAAEQQSQPQNRPPQQPTEDRRSQFERARARARGIAA